MTAPLAADLARLRAMARRFDAEEIRLRNYVANPGFGGNINSQYTAAEVAADAQTIRRVLLQLDPMTEGPKQMLAEISAAAE